MPTISQGQLSKTNMRGIFAIPPTPFDRFGEIDEQGLLKCTQFCLEAGVHGLVIPVWASEFFSLSDSERLRVSEIVVEITAHRVPVVIAVSGLASSHAAMFSRHACRIGADAVIALPPYLLKAEPEEMVEYFRVISGEAQLPVFIQNMMPPMGTQLSAQFMIRLVREIDGIEYIKEETLPAGPTITKLLEYQEPRLKGVMGGQAGRFLIEEYHRGACGTMPACEVADVDVAIWNALEAGDDEQAQCIRRHLLPLLNMEGVYGPQLWKQVLMRRGIIDSAQVRGFGSFSLDQHDQFELDKLLSDLNPYFTTAKICDLKEAKQVE
ncbi:MAG: dihydrodipicolinate synthase family protein [Anaerolineaceae bacterium]|nr:dihydrodipicolinate synthase family protein [Anaerolineaceae bacterium]